MNKLPSDTLGVGWTRIGKALDGLLSRATRNRTTALLSLICCGVIFVGVVVIRDIRSANADVSEIYTRSVHGLQRIAKLQYDIQETRRASLYALSTSDSNLQVIYADQSRTADEQVREWIAEYARHTREPAESRLANRLAQDWVSYLSVRDEVLASILEGSAQEAVALDFSRGVPAFDRVRQDLDEMVALYDREASQRLSDVVATSRRSSLRLVELLGFTLLLSIVAVWAVQRGRLLSTLELARLQMEFVASVSHELRTPLAVLRSASDNVADGLITKEADLRRYGCVLQNQSRRMSQLVDEILLFASTEDGKQHLVLKSVAVAEIIRSVCSAVEPLVQQAGFSLDLQIDTNLPPVMADLTGVCQCLQNLVGNAIKYSGSHRRITLCAGASPPRSPVQEVYFSVVDRGIGIDRAEVARIFEPFYRSPRVIASQIHGTGLGLPLARRIADRMGGRLTVSSELSVGSIFTLHLPADVEGEAKGSAKLVEFTASGSS